MELKNIVDFFVAAYVSISSAFFSHHSSCILRSAVWACLWRCLKRSHSEVEEMSFCHLMKAFFVSSREFYGLSSLAQWSAWRLSHNSLELFSLLRWGSRQWSVGSQPVVKVLRKHATEFQLLQFFSVKSWPAGFRSLATSRSAVQRQDRPEEAVISPTLCPPPPFPHSRIALVILTCPLHFTPLAVAFITVGVKSFSSAHSAGSSLRILG